MYYWLLRTIPRPWLIRLSILFSWFLSLWYYGKRYKDPISGKTYRKFLPYGYSPRARRENALCPGSLSLERHRLLWLFLEQKTDFFTGKYSVLHIAPEQCFYRRFRNLPNLKYITGDLNSPIADVHFDLHQIPFPENHFDIIFCNHVLEHVRDARQCMRELFRVMKPGGWGIFQVPIDWNRDKTLEDPTIQTPEDREKFYWQKDHVRLFGRDYPQWLEEAGFFVEENHFIDEISPELKDYYRLPENEILYICRKMKNNL
jgi:SAM-dependent methyltransferase